jgi:predicted metal-binding membrane protein
VNPAPRLSARPSLIAVVAVLLAGALLAWIVTIARMKGMDEGPGTSLGALGWYVGVWVTMMAAMMLPSAAPIVVFFAEASGSRAKQGTASAPTWMFVAGYLVVWTAFGLLAYGVYRLVDAFEAGTLGWDRGGPYVAGLAIAGAGLYELTPLKELCLRHCRSPLHVVASGWRSGPFSALRMGVEHGAYCVGCCWGLMVILFALGVMSLLWMAIVAAVIFGQKVLPRAHRLALPLAVAFIAFGVWVAAAPSHVPGLTQPGGAHATHMDRLQP